jgi:hypothetical protein
VNNKKLQRHFGDHEIPSLLFELVDFAHKHDGYFSAGFELSDFDGKDVAREVVGHHPNGVSRFGAEVRKRLALFGLDGDGSTYGLWFNSDKPDGEPPVVYLNSEGSDHTDVVAGNLAEFVSLLLLDRPDLGMFYGVPRDKGEEASELHVPFVAWASQRGFLPAARPKALVAKARKTNPGFNKWLSGIRKALDADEAKTRRPAPAPAKPQPHLCWLKVAGKQESLEKAARDVVAASRKLLPDLKIGCHVRYGMTDNRKGDFPKTGNFPADFAQTCELRVELARGKQNVACLILEPMFKKKPPTCEVSLWLHEQPDGNPALKGLLAAFHSAFKKLK